METRSTIAENIKDPTIPFTREELREFEDLAGRYFLKKVVYSVGKIRVLCESGEIAVVASVPAILYVTERFDLKTLTRLKDAPVLSPDE